MQKQKNDLDLQKMFAFRMLINRINFITFGQLLGFQFHSRPTYKLQDEKALEHFSHYTSK